MTTVRLLCLLSAMLAAPAHAEGLTLRLINGSSQVVTALSMFPLDDDGEAVEDNLGGFYDNVAPGAEALAEIGAACGPMLAVVMLQDGLDLRVKLDTCADTTLQLSDQSR